MILRSFLRAALLAAAIATSATVSATPIATNYTDMWSNAQEPGWGFFIDQQADVLLGTLYIYDKGNSAAWYTVTLAYVSTAGDGTITYQGPLYQTTGPALGQPYSSSPVKYREVGLLTIAFGDEAHALMNYTIDGAGAVKQVSRLTFAPNSILGSYIGSTQDVTYDCKPPAQNGLVTTDPGPFTITQNQDGYVLQFPTCQVTNGVYTQTGQVGSVDAIYNCPGGAYGAIKFTALQSEKGGIVGNYTGYDKDCSFRGNIGGMRVIK